MNIIRLDRNELPELPRLAYEIGAEIVEGGDIRVWVHGSEEVRCPVMDFAGEDARTVEANVLNWLLSHREFAANPTAWRAAGENAARRIAH